MEMCLTDQFSKNVPASLACGLHGLWRSVEQDHFHQEYNVIKASLCCQSIGQPKEC